MTKDVPYFQLYAANFLANREFRLMSLRERGLLISIYMECWVNRSVPSLPGELAKCLSFSEAEVLDALTFRVKSFLLDREGNFICPELEGYHERFMERRKKQSEGGKDGAKRKKEKYLGGVNKAEGLPEGQPKGSLNQINSYSFISNQLVGKSLMSDENKAWVNDFENGSDTPDVYSSASRGN